MRCPASLAISSATLSSTATGTLRSLWKETEGSPSPITRKNWTRYRWGVSSTASIQWRPRLYAEESGCAFSLSGVLRRGPRTAAMAGTNKRQSARREGVLPFSLSFSRYLPPAGVHGSFPGGHCLPGLIPIFLPGASIPHQAGKASCFLRNIFVDR